MHKASAVGMTREEFALALRQGRGAAPLYVATHGLSGIEEIVLAACLEEQAYDAQCEGHRALWLYGMFKEAPEYDFFRRRIIAALRNPPPESSGEQLLELAGIMARDGDLAAGAALRELFWDCDADDEDRLRCGHAVALLDGLPAVVEIARLHGRVLETYPDAYVDAIDHLVDGSDAVTAAMSELARLAPADQAIARYLAHQQAEFDSAREHEQETPGERALRTANDNARHLAEFPLPAVLEAARRHDRGRGKFVRFGRLCSRADLAAVLEHMSSEDDSETCLRLLWVFHRAAPPALPDRLWQLARHPDIRVRYAACIALGQASDPAIGEWARQFFQRGEFSAADAEMIRLFTRNYRAGDETTILAALDTLEPTESEAHDIGMSIRDFCDANNSPATAGVLLWLYRSNPCTICRKAAVEQLLATDSLPASIAMECAFDAHRDVRDMVLDAPLSNTRQSR